MPRGTWACLHEAIIYEYMMEKAKKHSLRMRYILKAGKLSTITNWVKVGHLGSIKNTHFPDIKEISFDGQLIRPAEVKFLTSYFSYHTDRGYCSKFERFKKANGCIVVLRHDKLPPKLIESYPDVDILELDKKDFESFIRENFENLLNRQLRIYEHRRTWIMQQSKNYWFVGGKVPPAKETGRWCPSNTLTSYDLSIGDTVIFVRHKGSSYQAIAKSWSSSERLPTNWYLTELSICQVTSPLQSRIEYALQHNIDIDTPLWYDETEGASLDSRVRHRVNHKWPYVFEFKQLTNLSNLWVSLEKASLDIPAFTNAVREVYTQHTSREISIEEYVRLLEYISKQSIGNQHTSISQV